MLVKNFSKRYLLTTLIFFGALVFVYLLFSSNVSAETPNKSWSWSSGNPVIFASNPITDMTSSLCPIPYQLKNIDGEYEKKKVCVTAGSSAGKVNFGTATYDSWKGFVRLVSFKFDNKMYPFYGPCDGYDSCLYLPGSDTLVTKQNLINGYVRSLVVYKNFTNRLIKVRNGLSTEYNFNSTNPEYIFQNNRAYAWPIGGFGASDDGKWLAVEFRGRGIGLLNVETLEMKRMSTMLFSYGTGYDPTSEIAVSNGGKQVAVMGINAGLAVFDVNSECGDNADDTKMADILPIPSPCKQASIDVSKLINRFYAATSPRFSDDGGELNFYAIPYEGESREITLRAAGNVGRKLDYLALGDSFTSGEGETDDKYYAPGTNDQFEKCHLSTRSYPYLLAGLAGIKPDLMKSVACSGATTGDVVGSEIDYWGQIDRLGVKGLQLSKEERVLSQTQAKYTYIPGRVHQETFVKDNYSKVITIGIGGNDAGLVSKLTACASPWSTCDWASDPKKKEQTAVEIKNIFDKLVKTYKKIHEDSLSSKIYVIGYPNIIDPNGNCDYVTTQSLDETERYFIYESVNYLNQVMSAAAKSAGVKFIDIQDSYGNQTLCGSKSPNANNGIRTGDDNNVVNDSEWFRFIGNEGFHPNSIGHSLIANSIHKSIDDLLGYDYCSDRTVICPDESVKVPEPSTYWIPKNYHNYPTQQIANFVYDHEGSPDNRQKDLTLDRYSLSPDSLVNIEVTSDPISLGNFTAAGDGSLNVSVNLPIGLAEGYHTVHLYGTSYSGDPIELYQVIKYSKPVKMVEKQMTNRSMNTPLSINIARPAVKNNINTADSNLESSDYSSNSAVKGDSVVVGAINRTKTAGIHDSNVPKKSGQTFIFAVVILISAIIAIVSIKINKRK